MKSFSSLHESQGQGYMADHSKTCAPS